MTPFPRAKFKALVAAVTKVQPAYVVWRGEQEPAYLQPSREYLWASIRVGTSSRVGVGTDDLRRTNNPDGSFTTNQTGRRQIILSFECFVWGPGMDVIADDVLDTLITRIWQPINLATVNAMALVIETCGPILPLPTYVNGRYISAAHVDLTVALANQETAYYPGGNGTIGEVIGTGTVTTESGGTITQTIDVKDTGGTPGI